MSESDLFQGHAYLFFKPHEVRFVDAAVARIIPADDLGPGAKEAGVTRFIDRQLASPWGTSSRQYRLGPWQPGSPRQGNQSPLIPQEIYRYGIQDMDRYCLKEKGQSFEFLSADVQEALLKAMESGQIELNTISCKKFFSLLHKNTIEGFFSDPMHGGNHNKIGWRLIGFPGVAGSAYPDWLGRYNEPYRVEPVSILDIEQGKVSLDAEGNPKHIFINPQ